MPFAAFRSIAALWLSVLAALVPALPAAAAAPAAEAPAHPALAGRMQACTPCHGEQGRASSAGYLPRIAGKPAGYLFNQLANFRDGRRPNAAMAGLVEFMDDRYLHEIAAYFAALELPHAAPQALAITPAQQALGRQLALQGDARRGLPACSACHGERLTGALPALPGLIGLPRDYLVAQIGAWRSGDRRAVAPDCMARIARALTPQDIEAVTLWLALQPTATDMRPAAALTAPPGADCGSGWR